MHDKLNDEEMDWFERKVAEIKARDAAMPVCEHDYSRWEQHGQLGTLVCVKCGRWRAHDFGVW